MAPGIQDILEKLSLNSFSEPLPFTVRNDPHQCWRCYIVDERFSATVPTFQEVEEVIRQDLAAPEIAKKTIAFFEELRKQYHVQHLFTSEQLLAFEPFQLKQKSA